MPINILQQSAQAKPSGPRNILATSQPQEEPGFFKGLAQGAAKPFLRAGVTAGKAGLGLLGLGIAGVQTIAGNKEAAGKTIKRTKQLTSGDAVDAGFFGKIKPTGVVKKDATFGEAFKGLVADPAGIGLEIGSTIAGGGATKGVVQTGLKGAIKESARVGAMRGIESGVLFGTGQALQDDDVSVSSVIKSAAAGGATGLGFGAVLGGVSGLVGYYLPRNKQIRINKAEEGIAKEYEKALNLGKTQLTIESRGNKDAARFLAKEGVQLRTELRGGRSVLAADEAIDALKTTARAENSAFESLLRDDGGYINLNSIRNYAKRLIKETGTARDVAFKKIDDEIDAFARQASSQGIPAEGGFAIPKFLANRLKQDMWKAGRFNALATPDEQTKAGAARLIGNAFKKAIEDSTEDANIKLFNQRLGDVSEAIFMLEKRNGSPVAGSFFGRQFARTIGAIAGVKGGPVGSIVGSVTADKITDFLQNPANTTWAKQRLLQKLRDEGKETLIDQVNKILEQRATQRASRLLLPAPSSLRVGPETGRGTITRGESEAMKLFGR